MKNKRLVFSAVALLLALLLILGGTFAYFTDFASKNAEATAGTVDIDWVDTAALGLLSTDSLDNYNPGDGRLVPAQVKNTGNKSVDIRQTVYISPVDSTGAFLATDVPQTMGWALFKKSDCTDVDGNFVPTDLTKALTLTLDSANNRYYYMTPAGEETVLNGNGASNNEVEDSITATATEDEFVLYFLPASDNRYQAAKVGLDLLAEAKQHRNTAGVAWTDLQTVDYDAVTTVVPTTEQKNDGTAY